MTKPAQEIFEQVVTRAVDERRAFLDGACGHDADCRAEVESLLLAHDEASGFLDSPSGGMAVTISRPLSEGAGSVIGHYKLLELIGEGGFGAVYMSDQRQPVRRRVALKIIKLGMDTKQVIARFEAERQALAMMDHPNIAKVLDAGATETGRPYFVMELVKGVPIDEYCDTENLTTKERLDLFIDVCNAVQHAHQKGIVHRDLKPGNVLIAIHDDHPVPKVIDFGIAKATNRELTDKTLFTEFRQFVGTPEYMSPEQAGMSGLDIDTRTDIYSLGVLLYQLLTGTTPFDGKTLREHGYAELQRIICEDEPPKPSTRLSTLAGELSGIAKRRGDDPATLARSLKGDLDWIVMKALEKSRVRRYETAREFAIDIRRHLDDQPVMAGPPGKTYRLRKFLRRNRVAVTAGTVVAVGLVIALWLAMYGLVQARRGFAEAVTQRSIAETARDEANQQRLRTEWALQSEASQRQVAQTEASRARAVTVYLTELLAQTNPRVAMSPDVTVRTILDSASAEVGRAFGDQPAAEATVRTAIGQAYLSLGEPALAEPHLRRALMIREQLPETSPAELYETLSSLTGVLVDLGHADLVSLGPRVIEVGLTVIGETRPELSATLGQLFKSIISGQRELSDRLFSGVVQDVGAGAPGDPVWIVVADTLCAYGYTLWHFLDNPTAAEPYFHEGLRIYRRELPAGHPQIAYTLSTLVTILNSTDQFEQAELLTRESSDILKSVLPEDHWHIALTDSLLGECLLGLGRFAEAETLLLASHEKIMVAGSGTATVYDSFSRLVFLFDKWGRPDVAAGYRSELARIMLTAKRMPRWTVVDAAFGVEHRELVGMLDQLKTLAAQSRTGMASSDDLNTQLARILADFLPKWRSSLPRDHALSAFIARQFNFWVASWERWGVDVESCRMMIEESLAVLRRWQLPADTGTSLMLLAAFANARGDHGSGEGLARESLSLMRLAYGEKTWFTAVSAREVGRALKGQKRYAEAEPFLVDSYALLIRQTDAEAAETRWARENVIDLYAVWDKPERARSYVQTHIEAARRAAETPGADAADQNQVVYRVLTAVVPDLRDAAVALPFAERAVEMSAGGNPSYLHNLARCHFLLGNLTRAIDLQRQAVSLLPEATRNDRSNIRQRLVEYEAAAEG